MATMETKQTGFATVYNPFELARIGYTVVGNQNVVSFCEKRKLSRSVVSRLLNGSLKSPPRVSTIYKFVAGDEDKAEQMLVACGYPLDEIKKMYEKLNTPIMASDRFFSRPDYSSLVALALIYIVDLPVMMRSDGTLGDNASKSENSSSPDLLFCADPHTARRKRCENDRSKDGDKSYWGQLLFHTSTDFKGHQILSYYTSNCVTQVATDCKKNKNSCYDYSNSITCINDLAALRNYLNSIVPNHKQLEESDSTVFSIIRNTETIKSRYVIISAFQSKDDNSPDAVVLSAAQNLKRYIEKNKSLFTSPVSEDSKARIKFLIATNSGKVNDIFLNTYPNFGLDIETILLDGTRIVEKQEIPTI